MRIVIGRSQGRRHRTNAHVSQARRRRRNGRRHHGRGHVQTEIVEDIDEFFRRELLKENKVVERVGLGKRRIGFRRRAGSGGHSIGAVDAIHSILFLRLGISMFFGEKDVEEFDFALDAK